MSVAPPAPPSLHVAPRLVELAPAIVAEEPRRARPLVARGLFVLLFGGMLALLGFAFRAQIQAGLTQAKVRAGSLAGSR